MYEFHVPAMSCGHCVARITRALQDRDAGARVAVDLPRKRVTVESSLPVETLQQALASAGYPPRQGS
ncbi:MAG TPA: heavy-metal-associated domain-containing protein [Solimonas sp.]|nr:heavy-metal-associated domain-containing protein [Solimonas sp.]